MFPRPRAPVRAPPCSVVKVLYRFLFNMGCVLLGSAVMLAVLLFFCALQEIASRGMEYTLFAVGATVIVFSAVITALEEDWE